MAEYIDREKFIAEKRKQYCGDCERRKGVKRGKTVFCYEIGDAPCRSCGIGDILDDVEEYPTTDVVKVVRGEWIVDDAESEHCLCCGHKFYISALFAVGGNNEPNCCPNCGAEMDGGENDAVD